MAGPAVPERRGRALVGRVGVPLSFDGFVERAAVSRETAERLKVYGDLLVRWQKAINLVSQDSLTDLWRRHFLDSAQLYRFLPAGVPRLLDFGSGAGFPGLVLSIMGLPDVHLVESDGRKCAFLREAARVTGASITLHEKRLESIVPFGTPVVTARGFASLDRLVGYAMPYLALWDGPSAGIFLKGEHSEKELTVALGKYNMRYEAFPSIASDTGVVIRVEGHYHERV
jgi:16S rRNA (guanine527-N7)-methyltransferase